MVRENWQGEFSGLHGKSRDNHTLLLRRLCPMGTEVGRAMLSSRKSEGLAKQKYLLSLHSRHLHRAVTQEITTRATKSSGRKQRCLNSLHPALQQLWMRDLHWQLPSQGSQTHRPPRPVRDSMLAELGHGCTDKTPQFPELRPRTAVGKAGMFAM